MIPTILARVKRKSGSKGIARKFKRWLMRK